MPIAAPRGGTGSHGSTTVEPNLQTSGYTTDDIPQAAWTAYDLTTVLQDGKAMVAVAAETLQARMIEPDKAISIERIVPGRLASAPDERC